MTTMQPVKARVKNGRLVPDEPTDRPEGEEVELVPLDAVLDHILVVVTAYRVEP